jgi:hypothetical protein
VQTSSKITLACGRSHANRLPILCDEEKISPKGELLTGLPPLLVAVAIDFALHFGFGVLEPRLEGLFLDFGRVPTLKLAESVCPQRDWGSENRQSKERIDKKFHRSDLGRTVFTVEIDSAQQE